MITLENIKRKFPHNLTELEEQLVLEKDQYGVEAWSQIQGSWLNTRMIDVEVEGEMIKVEISVKFNSDLNWSFFGRRLY